MFKVNVGLLLLLLVSTPLAISQEATVAAGIFIGVIEKDGKGPYQLILNEAARRSGVHFSEKVYPLKRAINTFVEKKVLAIYGMTDAVIKGVGKDNVITSYPLGVYKVYIFTKKGEPVISNYAQLNGKRVGGIDGYQAYYQDLIKNNIEVSYFPTEENQLLRYEAGRFDAIVGFMPDWIPYLDTLDYDPNFALLVGYDYMTVWNTPEGRYFIDKISTALLNMKLDGTLKEILGERYMDFEYKATQDFEWGSGKK